MEGKTDEAKRFIIFHTQGTVSNLKPVVFFFQYMKTVKPYQKFSPEILDIFRK